MANDRKRSYSIESIEVLIDGLKKIGDEKWEGHRREHTMLAQSLETDKKVNTEKMEALNELRRQVIEDRGAFVTKVIYENNRTESDRRLALLESAKLSVTDAEKIERDVRELQQRGSDTAQQALEKVHDLGEAFSKLQLETASRGAVEDNQQELKRYQSRVTWLVIGNVIALFGVVAAVIFGILAYLKH